MNNRWLGVVLAIVLVLGLTISAEAKVQLTVLRPGTRDKVQEFLEPAIAEFEQLNPDVEVRIQYSDWNEYLTRLQTWMAAGSAPDVFLANDHTMPYYADLGLLMPLDEYLDPELFEQIPPSLWEAGRWQGRTYLVPASVGAIMLMWHKDLFAEAGLDPNAPPANVEEFVDTAIKTTRAPDYYGFGMTMGVWDAGWEEEVSLFYHAMTQQPWFDEDLTPLMDTDEAREAFQLVIDLANKYEAIHPNPMEFDRGDMRPVFRDKRVAMHTDGPWIYPMLAESFDLSSEAASEIGIGLVPSNGPRTSIMGADGWVVYSGTRHPEEAAELLNFLVSEEQQYRHGILYGVAPTQERLVGKGEYGTWYWRVQADAVKAAFPRAHTPFTQEFYIDAFELTQLALSGQMPASEAWDRIVDRANELAAQW